MSSHLKNSLEYSFERQSAGDEGENAVERSALIELCFSLGSPEQKQLRLLAWANSICLIFVVLAFVGLKTPVLELVSSPPKPEVSIPVLFEPPQQLERKPMPSAEEPLPEESTEVQETPMVIAPVAADSAAVAFAVPVEGPVVLVPAQLASPPPRVTSSPAAAQQKSQVVQFNSATQDGGLYPDPDYPRTALQRRLEGRVMLYVEVDERGGPQVVQVRDSSGHAILDSHAINFVQRRWRWPAGQLRRYYVPFRFHINKK